MVPISIAAIGVLLRLALIPEELSTTDGVNFALSLERFDLAQHQPHFPGYPLYVLCARGVHFLLGGIHPVWALTLPAILATIPMVLLVHRALKTRVGEGAASLACIFIAVAPTLVTVSALPRSDGFAASLIACAVALAAIGAENQKRSLFLAAGALAGLALGVRPSFAPLVLSLSMAWALWNGSNRFHRVTFVGLGCFIGIASWLVPFLALVGLRPAWQAASVHTAGHFNAWGGSITTSDSSLLSRVLTLSANSLSGMLVAVLAIVLLAFALRFKSSKPLLSSRGVVLLVAAIAPYFLWVLLAQNVDRPRHAFPLCIMAAVAVGVALTQLAGRNNRLLVACALVLAIGFPLGTSAQHALLEPAPQTGRADAVRWIAADLGIEGVLLLGTQTPRLAHYYAPGLRTGLARHGADVLRAAERYQDTSVVVIVTSDVPGLEVQGLQLERLAQFSSTTVYAARTQPDLEVAGTSL